MSYLGRSVLTTFGLEGLNATADATTRSGLLAAFLAWAEDAPQASIVDVTAANASGWTTLQASLTSPVPGTYGVSYRWDMGDGTPFLGPYRAHRGARLRGAGRLHRARGGYRLLGNVAIGALQVHGGGE